MAEDLFEMHPVDQAGEHVGGGQSLELVFRMDTIGDVLANGDIAGQFAFLVSDRRDGLLHVEQLTVFLLVDERVAEYIAALERIPEALIEAAVMQAGLEY